MPPSTPPRRVAVDTGALLALASSRDQYHQRARNTLLQLQTSGTRFVGHALVLGELHGHLIRRVGSADARRLVVGLLRDKAFEWREVGPELIGRAFASWIERLSAEGITGGCSAIPKLYCPTTAVSRDQMAVFLVRAFGLPIP